MPPDIWLVFTESTPHWWCRWLKPGFRHVSILYLRESQWILVRPIYGFTDVVACPWREGDIPQTMIEGDAVIIPVKRHESDRLRALIGLQTCVSWAKACLGVRKPLIFTPYQLYKWAYHSYIETNKGASQHGSEHFTQAASSRRAA